VAPDVTGSRARRARGRGRLFHPSPERNVFQLPLALVRRRTCTRLLHNNTRVDNLTPRRPVKIDVPYVWKSACSHLFDRNWNRNEKNRTGTLRIQTFLSAKKKKITLAKNIA